MSQPTALLTLNKRSIAAIVATITGLAVVGSAAMPAMQASASASDMATHTAVTSPKHDSSQAASDLRVTLNNLLREHVTTNITSNRAIAGAADQRQIAAAEEAEMNNTEALAQAVGSIYGGEAQAKFGSLFREHIEQSNKFAVGVANNDPQAKQMAQAELQEYLHDLAGFFSTAIPSLPMQDVYGLLNEHEELVNKSTEAYKAGDFVQSYQMEREALKQVSRIADALSSGIVASMPEKF